MRLSLRTKITVAILAAIVATVAAAAWAVNDRIDAGARREADGQARAQTAQARALYNERAATLMAEGESIALYPAVIAALQGGNAAPLLRWSGDVTASQSNRVTVVDANGRVIARGHAPQSAGDELASSLEGLRIALDGRKVSGVEAGDEIGLALRGYAPVRAEGRAGTVVGAVMIAEPLEGAFLTRLAGEGGGGAVRIEPDRPAVERCDTKTSGAATCRFALSSPGGDPLATLALTVPLTEIRHARADAQRALLATGAAAVLIGAVAAWLLAASLTRPLARLTASSERIAAGEFHQPLNVRSSDEIGVLARSFDSMRERVAASTYALRDERDVLNAVLESAGAGLLMTDAAGTPLIANRRWQQMLGGEGLTAGTGLERVGVGESLPDAARGWLADCERVVTADFERFEPYRRFRLYTAPVHGPGHQGGHDAALGRIFVLRDVTRESEAERMRTALIATVSHELRSPLTAIKGYTDSLLDSGPWDATTEREFLTIIAASADKLAALVDNLLDAAKMEAGVLRMEREPVRVERIAQLVAAHRQMYAASHPVKVEAAPNLPLADADPMRIEQVIANLVDNAIKYSPDGGPITIRIVGGDMLTVSVSDRGVGIAPEYIERLFERFYRVEGDLARTTKGVGLGLYICKSLIEAHGGRMWVNSKPGIGSTFSFTLPKLVDPGDAMRQSRPTDAASSRPLMSEGVP
jgi:signal transduction histidine kinase/HAMP domain-containing protein